MSMGLLNMPMIFQHLMDIVLGIYRFSTATAYLDDLIISSSDLDEHIKHVRMAMGRLRFANLYIKLSKCQWLLPKIEYLGFIISDQGTQGNPDKIKPIVEYATPTNTQEVEQFLGDGRCLSKIYISISAENQVFETTKEERSRVYMESGTTSSIRIIERRFMLVANTEATRFLFEFQSRNTVVKLTNMKETLYRCNPSPLPFFYT